MELTNENIKRSIQNLENSFKLSWSNGKSIDLKHFKTYHELKLKLNKNICCARFEKLLNMQSSYIENEEFATSETEKSKLQTFEFNGKKIVFGKLQ